MLKTGLGAVLLLFSFLPAGAQQAYTRLTTVQLLDAFVAEMETPSSHTSGAATTLSGIVRAPTRSARQDSVVRALIRIAQQEDTPHAQAFAILLLGSSADTTVASPSAEAPAFLTKSYFELRTLRARLAALSTYPPLAARPQALDMPSRVLSMESGVTSVEAEQAARSAANMGAQGEQMLIDLVSRNAIRHSFAASLTREWIRTDFGRRRMRQ